MAVAKRLADEVGEAIRVHLMKDLVCTLRRLGLFFVSYSEPTKDFKQGWVIVEIMFWKGWRSLPAAV